MSSFAGHIATRPSLIRPSRIRGRAAALLVLAAALSLLQRAELNAQTPAPPASSVRMRAKAFVQARQAEDPALRLAAARIRAWAQAVNLAAQPRNSNFTANWQPLGPVSVTSTTFGALTGRVTAVAFDPNDLTGNTVYLGTTGGGVWKSTNAAGALANVSFAPLTDTLSVFSQTSSAPVAPSLSIGAISVQPKLNPAVLAGTGDPNDASDSLYGEGILRSADGGVTWTVATYANDTPNGLHSFAGLSVAGLAWSTTSPSLVVAAFTTSPESSVVDATSSYSIPGLYYSTDAGQSWHMGSLYDGTAVLQTPAQTRGGHAVTSVVWDAQRQSFYAAVRAHGYYASTDGITWQRLASQPGTNLTLTNCPTISGVGVCPIFRGTLAAQPATGDLYALTVDSSNLDQGLWQDLCNVSNGSCSNAAPTFSTRIDNGVLETGSGSQVIAQGDYNLSLAAAPSASSGTLLLAGTIDLYRCSLGLNATSCTWRNTTNALNGCNAPAGVAPAQHALAGLLPGSAPLVLLGNDGGLWRSTDGIAEAGSACSATDKSHFDNLNTAIAAGGSLAEVVGFAQSPTNADTLLTGLGQNGTASTAAASLLPSWTQLSAGEGGFPLLDPNNANNWFAAIGAGVNEKLCANGANCLTTDFAGAPTIGAAQTSYDASLLDAPMLLDPAMSSNLLTATCRVWRGPANMGSLWSTSNAISAPFGGGSAPCSASSPLVRSLAVGGPAVSASNAQNAGSQVIYAGLAGTLDGGTATLGGHVFRTTTANTANNSTVWADIAKSAVTNDPAHNGVFNPGGFDVSSVVIDSHDATGATVYATIMGFDPDAAVPHVYRSTDYGAHWSNISDNLPSAPANALVIDPNDANTVYIAMDTGVYATQSVSTCGTTNCWNLLGTGLPNAPVTTLAAAAKIPTGQGTLGMLRAGTYGRGLWQIPLLAAVANTQPAMALTPVALTFGSQAVGTLSGTQTITVTSNGASALTISSVAVNGDFSKTDNCTGATLQPNSTCTVTVAFAPTAQGTRTGTLTVYGNVSGGQATASLTGTGAGGATIVLTPLSLTFAGTTVNSTSPAQILTVANTGGTSATLQTPVLTGDFALSANTCTASLAPNSSCSLSITFTPTASGTRTGTLSIATSVGTPTATLTGTGNAPATDALSPLSLTFGTQTLNVASAPLSATLTNTGDTSLTLITASSSSNEFPVVSGCGTTLAAHAICSFSITFVPAAVGTRTATLTIGDQFRTQTVSLTGTGLAPAGISLSPASLSFGPTGVGLSAPAQTLTLTNNGGAPLAIASASISGDFVIASTTCGVTLPASQACTYSVVFSPTSAGQGTGLVTMADGAGTQTVSLSGAGVDFSFKAAGATSATLSTTNGSATFPLVLSSNASVTTSVALACSGAPAHTTCTLTPSSSTLGSMINVSAVVETGVATASVTPPRSRVPWLTNPAVWTAFALPLVFLRRREPRLPLLLAVMCVLALGGLSGCGAGRTVATDTTPTTPTPTPTPAGSYSLTVSATSAGVTHTVGLTLVVQ